MTGSHHAVLAVIALILGSCVGSFLNVCVYRIPKAMSLLRPRSRCPRCSTAIRARDNIPVLGWLVLRGRCRSCRGTISPRYAVVELTVGLLFAGVYLGAVSLAGGDLWEQAGVGAVLATMTLCWTLIGLSVVVALIAIDARGNLRGTGPGAWRRRAGRGAGPA